ncbi:hypothetical protein BH09CHL1_BH09CHL1_28970 [soil metagenome]
MYRLVLRLAILAMVFMSSFGIGVTPAAAQAQSERASLTIHSRFCPPNYDMSDVYNDCHGEIGTRGVWFSLRSNASEQGVVDFLDADGNITFDNLYMGEHTLSSSLRDSKSREAVYCSTGDGSNGRWIDHEPTEYGQGFYDISVVWGEVMTCDWYTIPEADFLNTHASISIRDRFCPVRFSDFGAEWRDCLDNPGANLITYRATGPTPLEANLYHGNAVLSWFEPGTYSLFSDMATYWDWSLDGVVYCSTWETGGELFLSQATAPGDPITLTLEPGDDVICDWYHFPTADFYQWGGDDQYASGGNTPISVVACDFPTQLAQFSGNSYPQCDPVYGVHLTAYPTLEPQYAQTCVYDGYSTCHLSLGGLIPLTVEMDASDIPKGWEPLCNPCTWWQYGEWTGYTIQLIPIDR